MSISDETLRLEEQLRAGLADVTDRHTRDLVAAYARGWDEVAGDLDTALQQLATDAGDGKITRALILRSTRLTRALAVIAERLTALAAAADVTIVADLDAVVRAAGAAQTAIIGSQLPADQTLTVAFDTVDANAIDTIVRRSTQQIHAATRPLSRDAVTAMRRELIRGLTAGSNPRETARRMLSRAQGIFEGGAGRAVTIARTETLDAHRGGAALGQAANSDVLAGWVWTASLTSRTCPACFSMHGTEHALTEPGPLGHQNCRCARTPKTKTWADLGFDLPEPPSVLPDAAAVFASLSPTEQLQILGPGRYQAWQAGQLPIDQWAVRRSTSGWRDSYVPVKPPSGGRSARLAS